MTADADALWTKTRTLLEEALRKVGLDPKTSVVRDESDQLAFGVMRGSAQVLLAATRGDRGVWVRAIAPVVLLPPEAARLAFYAKLLDLNAKAMRNAAFGVLGDKVVVVSERPAEGLDPQEVEQILRHVGATADHYDDLFATEYGVPHASKG
jgi:hypothetical protein